MGVEAQNMQRSGRESSPGCLCSCVWKPSLAAGDPEGTQFSSRVPIMESFPFTAPSVNSPL